MLGEVLWECRKWLWQDYEVSPRDAGISHQEGFGSGSSVGCGPRCCLQMVAKAQSTSHQMPHLKILKHHEQLFPCFFHHQKPLLCVPGRRTKAPPAAIPRAALPTPGPAHLDVPALLLFWWLCGWKSRQREQKYFNGVIHFKISSLLMLPHPPKCR